MVPVELAIETAHDETFLGAEYNEEEKILTLSGQLDEKVKGRIIADTVEFLCR
jgi:hypothetical protein